MALRVLRISLLALGAVFAISAIFGLKGPLQDVHWDAPIYLQRARTYVETPYIREFSANSRAIAEELLRFRADEGNSTPYWSFIRLGNTILLGTLTAAVGPGMKAIQLAFWLYIALLMATVLLTSELALRLIHLFGVRVSRSALVVGALISAGLYVASDVCRHLAGNFVAEVPALFLLSASALALVSAVASRSPALGVASGFMAFLMYVVKMDAIWVYLSLLLLLGIALLRVSSDRSWLPAMLWAAVTAAACYVAYALYFWPLPDPRLLAVFEQAYAGSADSPTSPLKLSVVAGGLLWFGLGLSLRFAGREKTLWFAVAWLFLTLLPYVPAMFQSRPSQVRMFALVLPPLLIASTIGWAALLDRWSARKVHTALLWFLGVFIAAAIALGQEESYSALRQLPGGWRLQYVKEWLSPPRYERLSYPISDLEKVSRFLYQDATPKVVVIDRPKNAELFSIIEYLRPSGSGVSPATPASLMAIICGRKHDFGVRGVTSCLSAPGNEEVEHLGNNVRVLYLQRLDADLVVDYPAAGATVFRSGSLILRTWQPSRGHAWPAVS